MSLSPRILLLLVSGLGYGGLGLADKVPANPDFPEASYPYYMRPNGCSSWSKRHPEYVRDDWRLFDYTEACDNHDRCYMKLDSNRGACDSAFWDDLRAACRDPFSIPLCLSSAKLMAGAVRGGGLEAYDDAQRREARYLEYVRRAISELFLAYVGIQIPPELLRQYMHLLESRSWHDMELDIYRRYGPMIASRAYLDFTGETAQEEAIKLLASDLELFGYSGLKERMVHHFGMALIRKAYDEIVGAPIDDSMELMLFTTTPSISESL